MLYKCDHFSKWWLDFSVTLVKTYDLKTRGFACPWNKSVAVYDCTSLVYVTTSAEELMESSDEDSMLGGYSKFWYSAFFPRFCTDSVAGSSTYSYYLCRSIFISLKWICIYQTHILFEYNVISTCAGICTATVQCNAAYTPKGKRALVITGKKTHNGLGLGSNEKKSKRTIVKSNHFFKFTVNILI